MLLLWLLLRVNRFQVAWLVVAESVTSRVKEPWQQLDLLGALRVAQRLELDLVLLFAVVVLL